jgi:hypothetical protein
LSLKNLQIERIRLIAADQLVVSLRGLAQSVREQRLRDGGAGHIKLQRLDLPIKVCQINLQDTTKARLSVL